MNLSSKTILITGGGRGIGRIVSRFCAQQGARVIVTGRSADVLDETVRLIREAGGRAEMQVMDVGDNVSVQAAAAALDRQGVTVDCLVNNAAVQAPIGLFHETDMAVWEANIRTSLLGTVYCTRAFLPAMVARTNGSIINFSGGGSTSPRTNFSAYGVAKTAVVRFSETVAAELRNTGVRLNSVAPGAINTDMLEEVLSAGHRAGKEFSDARSRKEQGGDDPRHISELVAFLASDASVGITGKLISAIWDPWRDEVFQQRLRTEPDLAALRRIDDRNFIRVKK